MHDLSLKNPNEIKQELDIASEELANCLYDFRRCEEFKKITFSQITLTKKIEKNCSVSEAEKWAYSDPNYATIIEGLLVAEKNYSILKGKYANLQSWVDLYRSWLVTQRDLIK
jgi:hypothetical protein